MMRVLNLRRLAGAVIVLALLPAAEVWAVGTAAGTSVDNQATVSYSVGGTPQTPIESSPTGNTVPGAGAPTSFLVDDMIDVTVVEVGAAYTSVAPGATAQVLTFSVTNTGNRVHDFSLANTNQLGGAGPFGATDNFDATSIGVFVESGVTAGFQAAQDTATFIDELAADASITVYIIGDIPLAQVDGDLSVHRLTAQAAVGGTPTAQGADILTDDRLVPDDPAVIQTIFADSGNDGAEFADDGFLVASAQLTIMKTSAVLSDPVTTAIGGANPKAIPGAIVEYTVTVANAAAAGASATGISVADDLSTEIGAGTVAFEPNSYGAGQGIQVTAPNINGGAATPLTNASDADTGDFTSNTVTASGIDLAPGESATVTYRVAVQ